MTRPSTEREVRTVLRSRLQDIRRQRRGRPGEGEAGAHRRRPRLARHVADAVLREESGGARLQKEHQHCRRRVDAAVAAVMALHRAAELAATSGPSSYV